MGSWGTSVGEGAPCHFARNYRLSVMTKQCVLCPSTLAPPFFMSTQSLQGPLWPPSSSPCLWASPLLSNSKNMRWRANLVKISTLHTFCAVHILCDSQWREKRVGRGSVHFTLHTFIYMYIYWNISPISFLYIKSSSFLSMGTWIKS